MASIVWIPVLFGCASLYLYFLAANLPVEKEIESEEYSRVLKFPSNLAELNELAALLLHYTDDHLSYVILLFCSAYIYKQTFAIPGSIFLNLLAGALFGVTYGFPLACVLSATGATCCYALSNFFGKQYILHYFSGKITPLSTKIRGHRHNLFFYLLSLRLFPVAPNWLMNMAAPVLDIPVHLFFFSVFFGLMPYNFLSVEAGGILTEITSTGDIFTTATTLKLLAAACVAILPTILVKRFGGTEKESKE